MSKDFCFRYTTQTPKAATQEPKQEVKRPYIFMELQSENGEWFKVNPLADTGADVTAFPRGVCEILGKKVEEGARVDLVSAAGTKLPLYLHDVKTRLGSKEFKMTVGFTTTHTFPHLLGRKDLLDHFTMKFSKDDIWFEESE